MPITINQPATITREAYLTLIRAVGFDTATLRSLSFSHEGITATVCATDEQGRRIVDDGHLAVHSVFIRVVDGD